MGGSRIEAKLDKPTRKSFVCNKKSGWYDLWLNAASVLAYPCVFDNLKLLWNRNNQTYSNNLGVSTRIPYSHGSTKGIDYLDPHFKVFPSKQMRTLVKGMEAAGGKRNISIRGFPYDWRRSPSSKFDRGLTSLVEKTYRQNNKKRVTLLSYSMGCNYVLWFLNRKGELNEFCLIMYA